MEEKLSLKISKFTDSKAVGEYMKLRKITKFIKSELIKLGEYNEEVFNWFVYNRVEKKLNMYYKDFQEGKLIKEYFQQTKKLSEDFRYKTLNYGF